MDNFEKENGMSVEDAWKHVLSWEKEGKTNEAWRGCEEIVKFFPDHKAKNLLAKFQEKDQEKKPQNKFSERISEAMHNVSVESETEREMRIQKEEAKITEAKNSLPDNSETLQGALSYAWIFVLIPLIFRKDSEFVRFHVRQGLVLFVILFFLEGFISFFFIYIMGHGKIAGLIINLATFLPIIFLGYSAWQGKWIRIPIIYKIAQKLPI